MSEENEEYIPSKVPFSHPDYDHSRCNLEKVIDVMSEQIQFLTKINQMTHTASEVVYILYEIIESAKGTINEDLLKQAENAVAELNKACFGDAKK